MAKSPFILVFGTSVALWSAEEVRETSEAEQPAFAVSVHFEGNWRIHADYLERTLQPLLEDAGAQGVDPAWLEDARFELERYYRTEGYHHAHLEARTVERTGQIVVFFRVREGHRSIVRRLTFEGYGYVSTESLTACFDWKSTGRLGLGEAVFTESELQGGVSKVIAIHELEGFYFARAEASVTQGGEGDVFVHVWIDEGPRVRYEWPPRLEFAGQASYSSDELIGYLEDARTEYYVRRLPLTLKGRLLDYYRSRGHLFADVSLVPDVDRDSALARIAVRVDEGPLTYIAGVKFEGNEATSDWVLDERMKFAAGDVYDERRVGESYLSLLSSGLFSSVTIEPTLVEGTDNRVVMYVRVQERARWKLSFLGGWGSYELLRGKVVLEDTNIFGSGHRLTLTGQASVKSYGASIRYLNPFVYSDRMSHTAKGFYDQRQNPSFTEESYGAETGLIYSWNENVQSDFTYRLKKSDAYNFSDSIPEALRSPVLLSSFLLGSNLDYRNSVVDPSRGSAHSVLLEYSGRPLGSELDFIRMSASTGWILQLGFDVRLVTSARIGVIGQLDSSQVIPVQERYYLGGENTVRSFKQDEAGPAINGDPVGGEAFDVYNLELRFPLFVPGLYGAAFGDAGSLAEDFRDFAAGRYFFGVGGGVRYATPFGPLRLDLAVNPDRKPDEDVFVIHLTLGYPF